VHPRGNDNNIQSLHQAEEAHLLQRVIIYCALPLTVIDLRMVIDMRTLGVEQRRWVVSSRMRPLGVGFGRIVASEIKVPNMFENLI
jgi:hypothetical protein